MRRPVAPGATGSLCPTRAPGCGVAFPLRDTRAPTTTPENPDSLSCGLIAIESSSAKDA